MDIKPQPYAGKIYCSKNCCDEAIMLAEYRASICGLKSEL